MKNRSKVEVRRGELQMPETIMIHGKRAEEKVPWLERSVIGEVLDPTSLDEVRRKIAQVGVEV